MYNENVSLSVHSRVIFWPFECMLKNPKNDPLIYAQEPQKWPFEHTLKDPKNDTLSICSRTQKMTLWAYAQGPNKWPFGHTLKGTIWLYILMFNLNCLTYIFQHQNFRFCFLGFLFVSKLFFYYKIFKHVSKIKDSTTFLSLKEHPHRKKLKKVSKK